MTPSGTTVRWLIGLGFLAAVSLPSSVSSSPPSLQEKGATAKRLGEVRPDKALVYIVRLAKFDGLRVRERVFIDDSLAVRIPDDSYAFTYVSPGSHVVWGDREQPIMLDVAPGRTYYVMFRIYP
jgi:hypothetical protein